MLPAGFPIAFLVLVVERSLCTAEAWVRFLQEAPFMAKRGQMNLKGPLTARQKTQRKYNSKPEQKKRRAQRNNSRRLMERKGLVRKGDGKDVDHNNHNTADNSPGNLTVRSASENRKDGGPRKMTRALLKPKKRKKKK